MWITRTARATGATARVGFRLLVAGGLAVLATPLLGSVASADDFSNATPINVPLRDIPTGCPPVCPPEKADPYPSEITVSGLTGPVIDINVIVRDLTWRESGPSDADIMVVAPGGKAVMLMSDACGDNGAPNPVTVPITLSFDDQAASPLASDSACSTGTFRPLDDDDDQGEFTGPPPPREPDAFPDAPAAPATTVPLATFNGIEPNGIWRLYVMDDMPNDPDAGAFSGRIAGGWTLSVATPTTASTTTTTMAATTTSPTTVTTAATTTTTLPATASTSGAPGGAGAATTTGARSTAAAAPAASVAGTAARRSTPVTLPRTGPGTNNTRSVGVGALLLSAGVTLIVLAQRDAPPVSDAVRRRR